MNIPRPKRLAVGLVAAAVFSISAAPSFAVEGTVGGFTFDARFEAEFEGVGFTGPINFQIGGGTPTGGSGAAYVSTPFDLIGNPSFSASFEFGITIASGVDGADGLVFVIQNDPEGLNAFSAGGGFQGYWNFAGIAPGAPQPAIMPSVAVEFDVHNNGSFNTLDDPNGNHVDIGVDGIPTGAAATPGFDIETAAGLHRCAWVEYDSTTTTLEVFLSDETCTKPGSPLISKVVDIQATVGNQAFIGFTSSTGSIFSVHRLFDFFIDLDPVVVVQQVDIDIKPGSFPNSINLGSGGATPVAVLGSANLDVNDIEPSTLTLGTAGIKTVGKTNRILCSVEDVSGSFTGGPEGAPDGFDDLVCHFVTVDISPEAGDTTATLSGDFTAGGTIEGTDTVNIVP